MTLYRLHPPLYHAKGALRRAEKTRFGMQRRDNELTSQLQDFIDKTLETLAIELCRGIIQKQRRGRLRLLLQQPQLVPRLRGHQRIGQRVLQVPSPQVMEFDVQPAEP